MSTPAPQSLQQSLAKLHGQLAGTPHVDEASRALLREILADVERLLHDAADSGAKTPEPVDVPIQQHRLEALAVDFEADHPALAASLRQFLDLLGRAGL